ncbi:metal-sensitive transcriptional regulator [Chitinimonas arctica]|uniref:Metal-sensitive transcriptional regulator n=1 Tax=Chitinimonas arctica TaxID=2594795 RepID=A0A516SGP6_9NEIS|nr:metal-sensitive transcriptional regulator [Chitinimonas arctica]QDQ27337.1 metal-sensitive transcriptional regulator [Chitinimonas arctica]
MSSDEAARRRVERPDKVALQKRLARVEGQVRAVRDMVAADRYCVDVITQIQAARAALAAVAEQLLDNHLHGCVARAMAEGDASAEIAEVVALLRKFR